MEVMLSPVPASRTTIKVPSAPYVDGSRSVECVRSRGGSSLLPDARMATPPLTPPLARRRSTLGSRLAGSSSTDSLASLDHSLHTDAGEILAPAQLARLLLPGQSMGSLLLPGSVPGSSQSLASQDEHGIETAPPTHAALEELMKVGA